MTTQLDCIAGALRIVGVLDASSEASAADATLGLERLGDMLAALNVTGALVPSFEEALGAPLPLPRQLVEAAKYALAVRLAPDFGVTPRADVVQLALDGESAIKAYTNPMQPVAVDPALQPWTMRPGWGRL